MNWPSDWECTSDRECESDYWYCFANEIGTGIVVCSHTIKDDPEEGYEGFNIAMYQPDEPNDEDFRDMTICQGEGSGNKVCKALGKLIDGDGEEAGVYRL